MQKASEVGSNVSNEMDVWCEIARVKKGRIYELGIESTAIDKRPSYRGSISQSSDWLRRSEHEEIMKKMQEENDDLKTRLEKTERGLELNNRML
ncbi:hypothetical protein S83_032481 [Arachis hypogaea]